MNERTNRNNSIDRDEQENGGSKPPREQTYVFQWNSCGTPLNKIHHKIILATTGSHKIVSIYIYIYHYAVPILFPTWYNFHSTKKANSCFHTLIYEITLCPSSGSPSSSHSRNKRGDDWARSGIRVLRVGSLEIEVVRMGIKYGFGVCTLR